MHTELYAYVITDMKIRKEKEMALIGDISFSNCILRTKWGYLVNTLFFICPAKPTCVFLNPICSVSNTL